MQRYFKTIRLFWSTAFASQLEYQLNFLIELLAMLGTLLGSIFILSLFFTGGRQLGDWTWESALVIQGVYTFLDGLTNALLRPNLTEIVNYVREGTLDYVLLFIANESVYTFINEQDTTIIDYALKQQVLLCSPLSLYAILSLIHQSVNNFVIEQRTSEVLKQFQNFTQEWEKYKKKTTDMGNSLQAATNHYNQLVTARSNKLEIPLDKIKSITGDAEVSSGIQSEGQQKL